MTRTFTPEQMRVKAKYSKQYYHAHKEKAYALVKARKERVHAMVKSFKDKPCADCGNRFPPECMDFDHVFGKKSFNIAHGSGHSIEDLLAEILKCEVVCANCHRIRTTTRRK